MSTARTGPLAAVATVTPRADPRANEDACGVLGAAAGEARGVVVADGLGSYSHARLAARAAVRGVEAGAKALGEPTPGALRALFTAAHVAVRETARCVSDGDEAAAQSFGTTLLVALDTPAELWAAYAGNGAIWHVRGNFADFPAGTALPWCAVNLLAPHSVLHDGREVLYRIVDAADEAPPTPAVVRLQPDADFGDLLVVCTDGIYSADQLTQGTDVNGSLWISGEATLVELFRALRQLFAEWDGQGEPPLEDALAAYLERLRERGMLEDDATVGVVVTAGALDYHRRKRARAAAVSPSPSRAAEAVDEIEAIPVVAAAGESSPLPGAEEEDGADLDDEGGAEGIADLEDAHPAGVSATPQEDAGCLGSSTSTA